MRTVLRAAVLLAVFGTMALAADRAAVVWAQDGESPGGVVYPYAAEPRSAAVRSSVLGGPRRMDTSAHCTYSEVRALAIDPSGLALLDLDLGSGELSVQGRAGLDEILVEVTACASEERWLDELRVTVDEIDGGVRIEAHYPDFSDRDGGRTASLDLVVRMPLDMDVRIDDSSGDIEVSGAGDLWIDDSSGAIRVEGVNGEVDVDDSSGDVRIRDVAGDVRVDDSSGGLEIRDVQGSVTLRDGSGGIDVFEVDRDVYVESDGSGSIDVRGVGGDFTVARDGGGSVRYSDVAGRVDIPDRRRRGGGG